MVKLLLFVAISSATVFAAYDDLPKPADPYEPPGYEPEACPDKYSKIITQLRSDLGKDVSSIKFTNQLGSRVQKAFGSAHEIMMGPSAPTLKTNFNGTICQHAGDDGFNYVVYPSPGKYDINNVAVEEYFEKFAEFAALGKGANIADLPKDPRAV
ncbi:GRounDhog (hedgehog-like family) [Caenorhabditis elegans]|uniref:GRounDhog (Hedgehog-like family) n=1 Tax=Caenorhabditis elegans TaxID=6239 RepID=O02153_CAEEL|nr:GRounDhog (hedgehog-like family) [Caenorhabditis elegans]CCD69596.1 GRounDhog (hedgehog-like family) [Caenorhabditis elegans]|eukprot:NP_509441.2 GRounDhog (hedgehog-like family) [Caenorhabditis elegans]